MRSLIFIFVFTVVSFSQTPPIEPGVSQELARWRAEHYSDVRYKLNLTLEKMSPVLRGTIEIKVKVAAQSVPPASAGGAAPIILDWRKIKGFEDRSAITNVELNGKEVRVTPSGVTAEDVRVTPSGVNAPADSEPRATSAAGITPKGVTLTCVESNEHLVFRDGAVAGENVIKLDFTSPILPSGSAITRYIDKEDGSEYIYSLFVPSDASTAFPVFDQPDLKARFGLDANLPIAWTAISNGSTTRVNQLVSFSTPSKDWRVIESFAETKPISTYVFAIAAGPFESIEERTEKQVIDEIALEQGVRAIPDSYYYDPSRLGISGDDIARRMRRLYVRKSQLSKLKSHAAEVFRLNREGIRFLEEYFNYKFPFPKYDLVLIPEFPFGGMEHAGATFLRESSVIFPSEPTANDYISRANLIFHEAAHQWFGDTVTMRWFDDLWLKEGFAEFMAYKTLERVMPQYNAWKAFYERNKQSAYLTDSTRGTTPIYQEIKNLSAAKSAYGNIVYRKAPSFLRQAEFYIGPDKFQTAVRAFLKRHEFANAGWEDLVKEFEVVSGSPFDDMSETWIKQPGMWKVRMYEGRMIDRRKGRITNRTNQFYLFENTEHTLSRSSERSMMFNVLVVDCDGSRTTKGYSLSPQRVSISNQIPLAKSPCLVFPNYQDYGYGIFLLDDKSREYVLKNIQNEKDDFLRSMMWGSLWDSVREGELDPKEYIELVIRVVGNDTSKSNAFRREETVTPKQRSGGPKALTPKSVTLTTVEDETTVASLLNRVSTAMTYYLADKTRDQIAPHLETMLIEKMSTAPTLGQRITYYRALLNIASSENARNVLKAMLSQQSVPPAVAGGSETATKNPPATAGGTAFRTSGAMDNVIPMKTKDRFDIVTKLASLGDPDAERLLAELEKTETSDDAKRYAYAARAAFPTKETKEKYWNDFVSNKEISESWIEAAFGPYNSVRHADLTLPYLERALKELPNHKRNRKIFFVNGWLAAFIGGQKSPEALAIVNEFLADNPDLDRDLRLKILENVDLIERAVKIRAKSP